MRTRLVLCITGALAAGTFLPATRMALAAGTFQPEGVPADIQNARGLMKEGKLAEAAAALEAMVAKDADRPFAWQSLGMCYHRMKNWEKAITAHTRAAEFEDIRAVSLYNVACAKAMSGDKPGAIAALRKAVDAGFNDAGQLDRDDDLARLRNDNDFRAIRHAMAAKIADAGPKAGPGDAGAVVVGALGAKLDAAVVEAGQKSGFSGEVLVEKDGQVILHKGYGLADRAKKTPVDASTVFSIGSITKAFTAAAILALEQDGKLAVSDPISKHLAGVPAEKAEITIHHLLTHAGGIVDYVDRPGEGGDFAAIEKPEAFKRLMESPLLFKPGQKSEYSNGGYVLLAMIIEKASGKTYQNYVRERLFKPAGMSSSGFYSEQVWPDGRVARGYGRRDVRGEIAPNHWPAPTWALLGAGGIVSSTTDLNAWVHAMEDDRVLNSAQRAKAFTAYFPVGPAGAGEGYGWMVGKSRRGTTVRNVGGANEFGFGANIFRYGDDHVTLIATCNAGSPDALEPVSQAVRAALFEQ